MPSLSMNIDRYTIAPIDYIVSVEKYSFGP